MFQNLAWAWQIRTRQRWASSRHTKRRMHIVFARRLVRDPDARGAGCWNEEKRGSMGLGNGEVEAVRYPEFHNVLGPSGHAVLSGTTAAQSITRWRRPSLHGRIRSYRGFTTNPSGCQRCGEGSLWMPCRSSKFPTTPSPVNKGRWLRTR